MAVCPARTRNNALLARQYRSVLFRNPGSRLARVAFRCTGVSSTGASPQVVRCRMSNFYTRVSYRRLVDELHRLRGEELPAVSRAKQVAAAEGDLSENTEYHANRERLDMLQRRIYEIEEQLRSPRFIEELQISCERVSIGTRVVCLDLRTRKEVAYTILGLADAVPEKNIISYQSPMARGLIGKVLDDEVAISIPAGQRHLRIVEILRFDEA